ncbi:Retrovirus-related Pol polyprotein from transposon opus [Collichthys lucidus]|uniref:ribonuclease H n=1 Tax=Collichthys lucidus TaxID=240159 RepID=A0A4V6AML4_COLLU|nr:Retrovirus-related Pol polyprotein from transposon opus [Collichthys lucidus]
MLCKNVDVADGLVNGVCGLVSEIVYADNENKFPRKVYVKFDHADVGKLWRKRCAHPPGVDPASVGIDAEEERVTDKGGMRLPLDLPGRNNFGGSSGIYSRSGTGWCFLRDVRGSFSSLYRVPAADVKPIRRLEPGTPQKIDRCKKSDLRVVAEYYGVPVSGTLVKAEFKAVLMDELVNRGFLSLPVSGDARDETAASPGEGGPAEEAVAEQLITPVMKEVRTAEKPFTLPHFVPFSVESTPGSKVDARLKVRLARMQLEKEEREREREREFQFRRELELKRLEADTAVRLRQVELQARTTQAGEVQPAACPPNTFDVSKHISLVPTFREAEVENYFGAFERIATALRWPEDVWAILLQCKLSGRAQEACSSLSVEDGLDYSKVKSAIMRAYELVPEAYRQRFRNLRKVSTQTHVDFAREKGILFDRWCTACKADDFIAIRELMLLEEFKNCVSERITIYLNEQKVSTLQQAATLADEFALTHKRQAEGQRRVTALRDTACSQSLILSSVLPPGTESDASAVVRGIEMGFIPAPLHRVHVQSELANGYFHVGVRCSFPIDGVEFIMGNDIAGGKVYPVPEVVAEPIPESDHDELSKKHPDVFTDELPPDGGSADCDFRKPEQVKEPVAPVDLAAPLSLCREALIAAQQADQSLTKGIAAAVKMPSECTPKQPYFIENGVLMRRKRMQFASKLAKEALSSAQGEMKQRFDRKAVVRQFQPGDEVLVLLPTPGSALTARFTGPYVVESKLSDTDYVIQTPQRRKKTRLCHINMLKTFHPREAEKCPDPTVTVTPMLVCVADEIDDLTIPSEAQQSGRLSNSDFMSNVEQHLSYLSPAQQQDVLDLIAAYPTLYGDVPSRTHVLEHDIDVSNHTPIKQHAYRCPYDKRKLMKKEVAYLVEHGLARPSCSPWSSPCLLAPKSDGTPRFCTDFRRVNAVTVPDSFPLPRMDDCIDSVGPAVCITKLDLLKGYWQVPLTQRASDISAFVTPDAFMQYTVMAFGMRNAPATFQRLMQRVLGNVPGCSVYLDDVVVYSKDWVSHMSSLRDVFQRLAEASLTLNLAKCEFGKAMVTYLGKRVGHGQVLPVTTKIEAVLTLPTPTTRRELRRFLGMAGYYRCFCKNFSIVVAPLTKLCSPAIPFVWDDACDHAFTAAKSLLCSAPVLAAPDFTRPFKLEVDASAIGAGAVLLQDGVGDVCHPVCYFSVKFKKHQLNYSTIEKETLAMLLALQHFEVYVGSTSVPVTVYTDHNPLVFLMQMYNSNQRLMRWALQAQRYNIVVRHKRGADNLVADMLSRG